MSGLDRQAIRATESLVSAIRSCNIDAVEKLLKSDFEIEFQSSDHYSVLHTAVHTAVKLMDIEDESNKHLNPLQRSEALQQILKVIVEFGRFNVDALTLSSQTALHFAVEYCRCKQPYRDDLFISAYKALINSLIELLLKNNANINAKNIFGETPLMMASHYGCSHIVKLLLDRRDDLGVGVDLNARDIHGETALIKAAKWARVDVIDLLLQYGCLDKFHDHRGFSALHSVIYGDGLMDEVSSDFLALTGALASEEMPEVLERYAAHSNTGKKIRDGWPGNDSIQETVSMLVTRGRADINAKDFRGNTVLDLALKSKLRISQKTVDKFKEYGAIAGSPLNKHPEYPNITLQYTDNLGKTPFHRLSTALPELTVRKKVEIFMYHLNISPHKEALEDMTVAKDHRGRVVLHYAVMPTINSLLSDDIFQLINVLKLKRTINVRDNYGRTPLHYCEDEGIYKSLVEQGANEHIQDIDGQTPRDLKRLRYQERNRHYFSNNLKPSFNPKKCEKTDAQMIWNDSEYAYRDQFSKRICTKVQHFMNRLSDEIVQKDPRFECRPVLIGSAEEGTKTGLPDEFDFNFVLTKLSEECYVVPSPEAPCGFVHLKRRYNNADGGPENQHFQSQDNFARLFNSDGLLLTTEIASRFKILYLQVMSEPEFWKGEDFFEWSPHNEGGMIYFKQNGSVTNCVISNDLSRPNHPCSTIQLKLNRPIEDRYMFAQISLDIVPCIKVNGWWPEEALSGVNDEIKAGGCHLVFDEPQRKYAGVPFSDPFARISFAPAESRIIKECSAVARAAYMVGKHLLLNCDELTIMFAKPKLTYVLKTCLLYCIEALKNCTRSCLLYEDINEQELRFFVEKLMLCFHEFYLQDFLPCYLMPSFHLPIVGYFKSNHEKILYNPHVPLPLFVCSLYNSVCRTDSSLVYFCLPTPEQLGEKLNREELMIKLSMDKSYTCTEYQRVQPCKWFGLTANVDAG